MAFDCAQAERSVGYESAASTKVIDGEVTAVVTLANICFACAHSPFALSEVEVHGTTFAAGT